MFCCLPLVLVHRVRSRLYVDGDELVRPGVHVDVRAHVSLKQGIASPGKFCVAEGRVVDMVG